jgi:hypothetical protein
MPRVVEVASENVFLVSKLTSLVRSCCIRSSEIDATSFWTRGSSPAPGTGAGA